MLFISLILSFLEGVPLCFFSMLSSERLEFPRRGRRPLSSAFPPHAPSAGRMEQLMDEVVKAGSIMNFWGGELASDGLDIVLAGWRWKFRYFAAVG